ncbi:MAG: methyltransferase domain-containing protein [Cyanobacteriota bacterium]
MKYFTLIIDLIKDLKLVYINIKNSFYNFFLFIYEVISFYSNKNLRKIDFEFFKIYAIKDQFTISIQESKEIFGINEEEFTYGEAVWTSFDKILKFINPPPNAIFYDLGCGIGRICFFTSIKYSLYSKGIELLPTFIKNANHIKNKFDVKNILFIEDDWNKIDISDADIVYVATTCFDDFLLEKLTKKFEILKKNTKIISVSNELKSDKIKLLKIISLPFSWGKADVYIMEIK